MCNNACALSWSVQYVFYPFPKQALVFMRLQYKPFENTVEKGEIARNKQFLRFLQRFLHIWRNFSHFHQIKDCRLHAISIWKSLKFVGWQRVIGFTYVIHAFPSLFSTFWGPAWLIGNPGFLDSSHTGSSGFFLGSVLW